MIVVDEAILDMLRAVLPPVAAPGSATVQSRVHDGLVTVDNTSKVVTYPLPYAVYVSNLGDDDNRRLAGRRTRRSVFWSIMYVGEDRTQVKWAGQRIRDQLQDRRIDIPGHKTWPIGLEASQRIRRDDDAIRPDGSPLFYGVDEYAMSITLSEFPAQIGA